MSRDTSEPCTKTDSKCGINEGPLFVFVFRIRATPHKKSSATLLPLFSLLPLISLFPLIPFLNIRISQLPSLHVSEVPSFLVSQHSVSSGVKRRDFSAACLQSALRMCLQTPWYVLDSPIESENDCLSESHHVTVTCLVETGIVTNKRNQGFSMCFGNLDFDIRICLVFRISSFVFCDQKSLRSRDLIPIRSGMIMVKVLKSTNRANPA